MPKFNLSWFGTSVQPRLPVFGQCRIYAFIEFIESCSDGLRTVAADDTGFNGLVRDIEAGHDRDPVDAYDLAAGAYGLPKLLIYLSHAAHGTTT